MDILSGNLAPDQARNKDTAGCLPRLKKLLTPFSADAVEKPDLRTFGQPQNMQEIMRLRCAQDGFRALGEMICDKESRLSHCAEQIFVMMTYHYRKIGMLLV